MSNPNQLYEDIEKLNTLYEELCWDYDDELVFTHDGEEIIIYNKTKQEKEQWTNAQNVLMVGQQWLVSSPQWDLMPSQGRLFLEYGDVVVGNHDARDVDIHQRPR